MVSGNSSDEPADAPGPWAAGEDYPADPASLAAARGFVRRELSVGLPSCSPAFVDAVVQVVSELLANSILALASWCRLELCLRDGALFVEVLDDSTGQPVLGPRPDARALDGRGLHIVTGLASSWGTRPGARGKVTWARFALSP